MSRLIFAFLALLLAVACGSESEKGQPEAEKAPPGKVAEVPEADAVESVASESVNISLVGEGTTSPEEGSPQSLDLAIEIGKDGRVSGSIDIKGAKHDVSGVLDGDIVRCWVSGGLGDPASARRGTLVGKLEGDAAQGTFAVSNNGASEVTKGTWKVSSLGK